MQLAGLNVAINSDDAEMARRLNQEAAKSVKYGGMSEVDALKMVTINPAKMLHVEDRVGSIKVGKDADVVLWNENPLSIYAKSLYTIVDGIIYFDRERENEKERMIAGERMRIVRKMNSEKSSGRAVQPAQPSYQLMHNCGEHFHKHGLLVVEADELENK
jgi:cytosine/adenosine deaminase-related metal-dependent hydrolase